MDVCTPYTHSVACPHRVEDMVTTVQPVSRSRYLTRLKNGLPPLEQASKIKFGHHRYTPLKLINRYANDINNQ